MSSLINTNSSTFAVLNYNLKQLEVGVSALVASTPYQSVVGEIVAVDSVAVAVTVLPPTSPAPNDIFRVVDARANASGNNITVDFVTGGVNFAGAAANDVISIDNQLKSYIYIDATYGWGEL